MRNLHCVWFVLSVLSYSARAAEEKSWVSLLAKGDAAFGAKRMQEALQLFDESLQAVGEAPEQKAMSVHGMATVYQMNGDYSRAEVLYGLAIGYWEKAEKRPAHFFAGTYNNYGDLLTERDQFAKACEMYAKAVSIWQEAKDESHSRLPFAMSKLAAPHNMNGDSARAEALIKDAIRMLRKGTLTEPIELATSLDCLGKIYTYQRRFELA